MPHRPCFSLRTHGGLCAGEQWLYDGSEPIARLQQDPVEQPEQNLRYFDRNLKPVELRQLKLSPGGRPLLYGVQMYWKLPGLEAPLLQDIDVAGQDSDTLQLAVITVDPGGVYTSRRVLTLTYDGEADSYVYDFQAHLELHSPEVFDLDAEVGFEYCDPWYTDVPGPTVEFPGMWQKRFSHLLAEPAEGPVWQMPINHLATGIPAPQAFKDGGLLVLGFDPGNNPAFEFVGDTAARTAIGVCNWGYDIHFNARYSRDELYRPICPHFRIRLAADDKVQQLMAEAAPPPPVTYQGLAELPRYERHTSFAHGMRLDQPTTGPLDPWPWMPRGQEGAQWCQNFGRSDNFSLAIKKDNAGPSEWFMDRESDGAWTQPWTRGIGYKISAYIKTENVAGRGSFLAVRWGVFNYPDRYPYICSQKLLGIHDWTRVEVEIHGPPPPGISAICLILRQDGPGTTYFDDLDVELLKT
ncbi:MAG: hypothetical protein GKR89_33335 [Candidatus Latescibacteria bacterium]|nr:hypothetical protein [Candidatus Latescibacterota bacterium]